MGQIEKSRRKHLRNFPSQLLISRIESLEKFLEIPQRHLPYQKSISVEHTQSQKADQDTSGQKDGNQRQMIQQQKIQHMHRRSDNQAHQHRRRTYCFYDTNDQKQHQTESIRDDKNQNAAHILDEKQPFPGHRNAVKQIQLSGRLQKRKPSEGRQDRSADDHSEHAVIDRSDKFRQFRYHLFPGQHPVRQLILQTFRIHHACQRQSGEKSQKQKSHRPDSPFQIIFYHTKK